MGVGHVAWGHGLIRIVLMPTGAEFYELGLLWGEASPPLSPSLLPPSLPFSTSRTSRKIGDMAFSVAAPRASAADRLETHAFKSKLKSFMFHAAYSGNIV